jgi:hypothetical protein
MTACGVDVGVPPTFIYLEIQMEIMSVSLVLPVAEDELGQLRSPLFSHGYHRSQGTCAIA